MTNYRISQLDTIASGSLVYMINPLGGTPMTGSTGNTLDRVWGIMKETDIAVGNIVLVGGGTFNTTAMIKGQIYPCYLKSVQVSSGSFSLLS
jgi:hypothetical protein